MGRMVQLLALPQSQITKIIVSPLSFSLHHARAETGEALSIILNSFITAYRGSPNGELCHGPIVTIATDGESSFRKMRFTLGLVEDLDCNCKMGQVLYPLLGLNCKVGRNQILTTCDPKHIVKRFATMLRSPTGIQVGHILITPPHIQEALTHLDNMTPKKAELLLDPADKQNVPKAINLLQSLFDLDKLDITELEVTPTILARIRCIIFISKVLNHFLQPFINVKMTLSQQLKELSTYSHLITAMYQKHKLSFLTGALLADSQAIVKHIYFTATRLQILDSNIPYYILFEGTDRLEGLFSNVRTQDHAPNFDILQLSYKLSIATEITGIFERHPDLDRGHIRRNLVDVHGVDHINPKSWMGDVKVGNTDIRHEYISGRDHANVLLKEYLGDEACIDFDALFSNPDIDHLRPGPGGDYIGCRAIDQTEADTEVSLGQFYSEDYAGQDNNSFEDARDIIDSTEHGYTISCSTEELNPSPQSSDANYLVVGGKKLGKPELVAQLLGGFNTARKVTSRPLRAAGQSKEAALRQMRAEDLNRSTHESSDPGKVRAGDPGAILVRAGKNICLAVAEVLNFRQGNNGKCLSAIDIDDLSLDGGGHKVCDGGTPAIEIGTLQAVRARHRVKRPIKYLQVGMVSRIFADPTVES